MTSEYCENIFKPNLKRFYLLRKLGIPVPEEYDFFLDFLDRVFCDLTYFQYSALNRNYYFNKKYDLIFEIRDNYIIMSKKTEDAIVTITHVLFGGLNERDSGYQYSKDTMMISIREIILMLLKAQGIQTEKFSFGFIDKINVESAEYYFKKVLKQKNNQN